MHSRSAGVRGMVFGSLMAALIVIFALVPFLSIFMPIPLVLAYVRYGGRVAGLTAVVAGLFSALFVGPVQAFLILVPAGLLPGLAFGFGFRRNWQPLAIGILAVSVFFLGYAAEYTVTRAVVLEGRDPIIVGLESEQGRKMMDTVFDGMQKYAESQPKETEAQKHAAEVLQNWMKETRENPGPTFWMLLPFSVFALGVITTWANYMLCRWILPRFGHAVPAPTPFGEFRLPIWLSLIFPILSFAFSASIGESLIHSSWWVRVLINVLPPLQMLLVLAGIAAVYGFLRKKNVPKVPAIGYSLLGFMLGQIGLQLYVMLAMWDSLFDFRGLGHGILKGPRESS